jgi:hypothetical protein
MRAQKVESDFFSVTLSMKLFCIAQCAGGEHRFDTPNPRPLLGRGSQQNQKEKPPRQEAQRTLFVPPGGVDHMKLAKSSANNAEARDSSLACPTEKKNQAQASGVALKDQIQTIATMPRRANV